MPLSISSILTLKRNKRTSCAIQHREGASIAAFNHALWDHCIYRHWPSSIPPGQSTHFFSHSLTSPSLTFIPLLGGSGATACHCALPSERAIHCCRQSAHLLTTEGFKFTAFRQQAFNANIFKVNTLTHSSGRNESNCTR